MHAPLPIFCMRANYPPLHACLLCPAGVAAYSELQAKEFASAKDGYCATMHQQFVSRGYFDLMSQVIAEGASSVTALNRSTEEQIHRAGAGPLKPPRACMLLIVHACVLDGWNACVLLHACACC